MDTQAGPCSVTPPYQSWGVLTGGCQEASTVTVHGVPVLQRLIFQSRLKVWTLSCILSQTKRVHLYKALVISQIKNWIQMPMIVELVSIQVMFCPSFPQVSCDQGYWDHVTCGLPFVILCLEITVRQGQQRDAQLSSLPSANHFSLMIKTLISFFYLRNKHRYVTLLKTSHR